MASHSTGIPSDSRATFLPFGQYYLDVTSIPGNDDGLEAGRRRDFRGEFRQIVHADPLLARLVERSYPDLPLRSTFVVSLATLLLVLLTQNMVMAAILGILLLAGHATVVHLLAEQNERGSGVVLTLLRGGCALVIVLIVGTALTTPATPVRSMPANTSQAVGRTPDVNATP